MDEYYEHDDFLEYHAEMVEQLNRLGRDTQDIATAMINDLGTTTSIITAVSDLVVIERYMEMELRLQSEMDNFLGLELVIIHTFGYLKGMSAEDFLAVQKIIYKIINHYMESVTYFRKKARTLSVEDSRLINLQKDMIEFADDLFDMIEERKDDLNEMMSYLLEQLE